MATLTDSQNKAWSVKLDIPSVEEIKQDHGIDLLDLEKDPLQLLRNDPRVLYAVAVTLCREQFEAAGLDAMQFLKRTAGDGKTDDWLSAIRDAIISFFPSGRASHVRGVLDQFDQMGTKTDELARAKMAQIAGDPKVAAMLNRRADAAVSQAMTEMETAPAVGT